MNNLIQWDPFRELEEFSSKLGNIFGGRYGLRSGSGDGNREWVREWAPLVDICEDDKEYVIKADLPDVTKEDLKVTVENGVLAIRGERKFEREEKDKDKKFHRVERAYGTFVRSFRVPEEADPGKIKADFKNGVLRVSLPKSEKTAPKQIEITE
jgi:HSP20 family protein